MSTTPAPNPFSQQGTQLLTDAKEWLGQIAANVASQTEGAFPQAEKDTVAFVESLLPNNAVVQTIEGLVNGEITALEAAAVPGFDSLIGSALIRLDNLLGIPPVTLK